MPGTWIRGQTREGGTQSSEEYAAGMWEWIFCVGRLLQWVRYTGQMLQSESGAHIYICIFMTCDNRYSNIYNMVCWRWHDMMSPARDQATFTRAFRSRYTDGGAWICTVGTPLDGQASAAHVIINIWANAAVMFVLPTLSNYRTNATLPFTGQAPGPVHLPEETQVLQPWWNWDTWTSSQRTFETMKLPWPFTAV